MSVDSADPLVSIIVITYNSSKYVLETLESAKAQTYQNIELIISDDCSKDETVALCMQWLADNKNRFVNSQIITVEKNTGIPANCNRGVKVSRGEWIKLIAGDDILYNDCIINNIQHVSENQKIQLLFSNVLKFSISENEKVFGQITPNSTQKEFFNEESNAYDQFQKLLMRDHIANTPSSFISKKVFTKYGMFDEKYPYIEDYPFWLKLTRHGIKLHLLDRLTVYYRIHEDSVHSGSMLHDSVSNAVFVRNEPMRQEYIYPYYTKFGILYSKSMVLIHKFFKNFSDNNINRFLFNITIKYLNPLVYILYLRKSNNSLKDVFIKKRII